MSLFAVAKEGLARDASWLQSALYDRNRKLECVDEGTDIARTLDVHLEGPHGSLRRRTALIAGKATMFAGFGIAIWSRYIQLL